MRQEPPSSIMPGQGEGLGKLLGGSRAAGGPSLTNSHTAPSLAEMLEAAVHMVPSVAVGGGVPKQILLSLTSPGAPHLSLALQGVPGHNHLLGMSISGG